MSERIAVVGIGLRYPDANNPTEYWNNILTGRRAFRAIPAQRLNPADYFDADPDAPDKHYATKAAVITDFEFDRAAFRVSGSTYRSTDMTHWLALTVGVEALDDAGGIGDIDRARAGVVIGNSLTGEFTRANLMRMRWPYVRRVAASVLSARGLDAQESTSLLRELEIAYKAPFPPANADTLAGGLSNTIAGRICNHLDLGGGGYTVDGACSSSLLAITTAASRLLDGSLDIALAGGVDLSIDPFELIGFAKTSALTRTEMTVYDRHSDGFWPGEGCGVVALMRERDALAAGRQVYAVISGWGVSSDGRGGITRPEADGHRRAIRDAYEKAGYPIGTVGYFEGHGTGTAVGDATEIEALAGVLESSRRLDGQPAALGTVKGNIGHTKAAAGVAGFIKTTLALHHRTIPGVTSHDAPHPALELHSAVLRVPTRPSPWAGDGPARAGVSSMGFGGINAHIALEAHGAGAPTDPARVHSAADGRQDVELLLIGADDHAELVDKIKRLADLTAGASFAEITDIAAALAREPQRSWRAAAVVRSPDHATTTLQRLARKTETEHTHFDAQQGVFVGSGHRSPRVALVFPGQGNGAVRRGALFDRFPAAAATVDGVLSQGGGESTATECVQPNVAAASLAGLGVLTEMGLRAGCAFGHSLGEIPALVWAGVLDGSDALELVRLRGRRMAELADADTGMVSLEADPQTAQELIREFDLTVCAYNAARRTVAGGHRTQLDLLVGAAASRGVRASMLPVSHAFHTPAMKRAATAFDDDLGRFRFGPAKGPVLSTVTGRCYLDSDDVATILRDQFCAPVRFVDAATAAAAMADLVVEVGPGTAMRALLHEIAGMPPVVSLDTNSSSLLSLMSVLGAAYALGTQVDVDRLFAGRVTRPVSLVEPPAVFTNPCEAAPQVRPDEAASDRTIEVAAAANQHQVASLISDAAEPDTVRFLMRLLAERLELPLSALSPDTRAVDDLHLSSITVGQIVNDVTTALGRPPLLQTTSLATASLAELAEAIDATSDDAAPVPPAGVADWTRVFAIEYAAPDPVAGATPQVSRTREWLVLGDSQSQEPEFTQALAAALPDAGGPGIVLLLPDLRRDPDWARLLPAVRDAAANGGHVIVVQRHGTVAGLLRSAHLEHRDLQVTVIDLADDVALTTHLAAEVARHAQATGGYREVRFDRDGELGCPVLAPYDPQPQTLPVTERDVVIVSGGGKSITFECAFALARRTGCRLVLLGRGEPSADADLAMNLVRASKHGVAHLYLQCDVTDPASVRRALNESRDRIGPATVLLHGAGRNEPAPLERLTAEDVALTDAPKTLGLRHLLAASGDGLRLVVAFSSIIGRAGLRGEAHYALANDRLSDAITRLGSERPQIRCLSLEWSVWSGAGMGERLGVIESLQRAGVTAIGIEDGVGTFLDLLADPSVSGPMVISGRTGTDWPTIAFRRTQQLPLARFLDHVVAHVPGVEIVADAELDAESDPYLLDHAWEQSFLFPSVMAMEAMVQVAAPLLEARLDVPDGAPENRPPDIRDARFLRPIVIAEGGQTTIRVAALRTGPSTVDVVIRSSETGFGVDHMRCTVTAHPEAEDTSPLEPFESSSPLFELDPATALYGSVMFQGPRFRAVHSYRGIHARALSAELVRPESQNWFGRLLPATTYYSAPGVQDAVMHAIQVCVPTSTLLPEGIDLITHHGPAPQAAQPLRLIARERSEIDGLFTYDADLLSPEGQLWQSWRGLRLRAVRRHGPRGALPAALLAPVLQRGLEKWLGRAPNLALDTKPDPTGSGEPAGREQTAALLARLGVSPDAFTYRPDGKPEALHGRTISASHAGPVTIVSDDSEIAAVDLETVAARDWVGLLPNSAQLAQTISGLTGEPPDLAATRVWCATECLRKAGSPGTTLMYDADLGDGWLTLGSGGDTVVTLATEIQELSATTVVAVLVKGLR